MLECRRGRRKQKTCMWARFTCSAAGGAGEAAGGYPNTKTRLWIGTFSCSGAGEAAGGLPKHKNAPIGACFHVGLQGRDRGHLNMKIVPLWAQFRVEWVSPPPEYEKHVLFCVFFVFWRRGGYL